MSIILIAVMGAFLIQSLDTLKDGAAWVAHTERVRFELAKVQQSLSDLGAGIAGFQLTHDERLFEPAQNAAATLDSDLADLRRLVSDNTRQTPFVAQLIDLAHERLRGTEEQRGRALRGDVAGIQAEIASGSAKRIMDTARGVIAQMQAEEKSQLDFHTKATNSAYRVVAFAIWGAAAIAILLLVAITVVTIRDAERLRRVQEELATTLRSVGDAVIATDGAGKVRFINAVAEQLTGWTSVAARGLLLSEVFVIFNEVTREPVESPVARVLRENTVVGLANHTILRSRDGTERPIEDSGAPIRGLGGEVTGVVLVFRDATNERASRRALVESADALREADRRKDVFLATLSHELRNPLAPIRTATRLLETPSLSEQEVQRSRAIISRQVRHMASLLDDLLDISRITRGVLSLRKERVDLRSLIDAAIETAQPAIAAKRHSLTVLWPDEEISFEGDPVRLTQVIANLLTNAAKYTRPGGQITLGGRRDRNEITVYVRDTGIGIAPEMLPKVFEMFSQIDGGQEHTEGGIGIGLALVKGFVELHGGHVEASSKGLDLGSEFVVHLPISSGDSAQISDGVGAESRLTPHSTRRILVADDNRDGAEIMAMLLNQSGYQVHLAFNGADAFTMAEEHRPDIAILDIGMPGMSGYEVARKIRQQPWGSSMRLIAVTGWGQEEDKRKALDAGFDHHLTKPIDPDALEVLMGQD